MKAPPGACDTHMHFYDTKVPGAPGTFLPGDFSVEDYRKVQKRLGLEREIGSFDVGCAADVCVWDWAVGPVALRRGGLARDLHERTFAFMLLGDERNLVSALVGGVSRYERGAS